MKIPFLPFTRYSTYREYRYCHLFLIGSLLLGSPPYAHSEYLGENTWIPNGEAVPNQVIVKLKSQIQAADITALQGELQVSAVIDNFSFIGAEVWQINGMDSLTAAAVYKNDPRLEYIEPDYLVSAAALPNDSSFSKLWGMHNTGQTGGKTDADIDAPEAWDLATGGNTIIAVIDTGVDYTHPDLKENMWVNTKEIAGNGKDDDRNGYVDDVYGYNFVSNTGDPKDDQSHGTHCAGTIAGRGNNGNGVAGVNWQAKIMALKFLSATGGGSMSGAIAALQYAVKMGAKLSSNSWGCTNCFSQALSDAIKVAGNSGHLFVAAAGNHGKDNDGSQISYPSSYDLDNIVAVAASDHTDNLASFSGYGLKSVDLAAPGVDIYSTLPGNKYGSYSGTSMATPHVSGVAGLLWSAKSSLTFKEIKQCLLSGVDKIPAFSSIMVSGGRLNVYNALKCATGGGGGGGGGKQAPAAVLDVIPWFGLCLTLDGSKSTDPDGSIVSYSMVFENKLTSGEEVPANPDSLDIQTAQVSEELSSLAAPGAIMTVCFIKPGTYQIKLTVTDNDGLTGSIMRSISFTLPKLSESVAGGISVNNNEYAAQASLKLLTDKVDVSGEITVKSEHVGQLADIVVFADVTVTGIEGIIHFMLGETDATFPILEAWDEDLSHLIPFKSGVTLEAIQSVPIYKNVFYYPGTVKVYLGYRLADGTLVSSAGEGGVPIDIIVLE